MLVLRVAKQQLLRSFAYDLLGVDSLSRILDTSWTRHRGINGCGGHVTGPVSLMPVPRLLYQRERRKGCRVGRYESILVFFLFLNTRTAAISGLTAGYWLSFTRQR